jgi:hypothetical protein
MSMKLSAGQFQASLPTPPPPPPPPPPPVTSGGSSPPVPPPPKMEPNVPTQVLLFLGR